MTTIQKRLFPDPQETLFKRFFELNGFKRPPKSLEEIAEIFEKFKIELERKNPLVMEIAYWLYLNVCHPSKFKHQSSAENLEIFVAKFFGGERVTSSNREKYVSKFSPPLPENVPIHDESDYKRRVSRNRLEKIDVWIGIPVSLKSLIPKNKEINIGSFSAEALFGGFMQLPIPNEREKLGSTKALLSTFEKIEKTGRWKKFKKKFESMVDSIFFTDWIICIRSPRKLKFYFIKGESFRAKLKECIASPRDAVKVLNRFELHALRIKRDPILDLAFSTVEINLPPETDFNKITGKLRKEYYDLLTGKRNLKASLQSLESIYKSLQSLFKRVFAFTNRRKRT